MHSPDHRNGARFALPDADRLRRSAHEDTPETDDLRTFPQRSVVNHFPGFLEVWSKACLCWRFLCPHAANACRASKGFQDASVFAHVSNTRNLIHTRTSRPTLALVGQRRAKEDALTLIRRLNARILPIAQQSQIRRPVTDS